MKDNIEQSRIAALDGVRGAAVLMVMLYHFAHVPLVSTLSIDTLFYRVAMTGWVGVDIFFALSGFLITGILLRSKTSPNYFILFYLRRAFRIFPLYYLYLALLFLVLYPCILTRVNPVEYAKMQSAVDSWPWFVLYLSNLKQAATGIFFGAGAGHLWSLAIEEQFYLVWPLVVWLTSERTLSRICLALLAGALALRVYLAHLGVSPEAIYVFTPARLDGLICGALLAIMIRRGIPALVETLLKRVPLAFLLIIVALVSLGSRAEASVITYTMGFSVLAVAATALVYFAMRAGPNTVFSNRALIMLGKYSYSLYIVHPIIRVAVLKLFGEPRLVFGTQIPWQFAFSAACIGASLTAALISWHVVEKHFMVAKNWLVRFRANNAAAV